MIEHAKGMIMLLRGGKADEALETLCMISRHANLKLNEVTAVAVSTGSGGPRPTLPAETGEAVLAELRRSVLDRVFEQFDK